MFDTRPQPLTDPKHLDEFDRIFKHNEYAEESPKEECKDCECSLTEDNR
jgi:hypothetical protein